MQKIFKIFPYLYLALLILSFFYVKNILNNDYLSVKQVSGDKKSENVKPVKVKLDIYYNQQLHKTYEAKLLSNDTFNDFLKVLSEKNGFIFEKTRYVDGIEYEKINNLPEIKNYHWEIFKNEEEITLKTENILLNNNDYYKMKYLPR